MQQNDKTNFNQFDGFYHYHTLNKKINKMTFLASKRSSEIESFESNLSVNPFLDYYKTKSNYSEARKGSLLGMTRIVIDVDVHNTTVNNQINIIKILTHSLMNERHDIDFSEIIQTGRGIQVYINIEQTSYVLSWLYEKASRYQVDRFIEVIKDIKNDYNIEDDIEVDIVASVSPHTLIRVPDTVNSINKVQALKVYDNNQIYQLNDLLIEEVVYEFINTKFTCDTFEKNLINSRLKYLTSENHKVKEGNRMKTLFLLYNNLVQIKDLKIAKDEVYRFNRSLKQPLKSNELEAMFKYINRKGFLKFKSKTFNEWVEVESIETKRDIEAKNRKKKALRDRTIKALLSDDKITYQQIADQVNVSIITVKRHAEKHGLQRNKA